MRQKEWEEIVERKKVERRYRGYKETKSSWYLQRETGRGGESGEGEIDEEERVRLVQEKEKNERNSKGGGNR